MALLAARHWTKLILVLLRIKYGFIILTETALGFTVEWNKMGILWIWLWYFRAWNFTFIFFIFSRFEVSVMFSSFYWHLHAVEKKYPLFSELDFAFRFHYWMEKMGRLWYRRTLKVYFDKLEKNYFGSYPPVQYMECRRALTSHGILILCEPGIRIWFWFSLWIFYPL